MTGVQTCALPICFPVTIVTLVPFALKKILLLSDTHSYIDESILKYVRLADEVWHAGDIGDLQVTDTIKAIKPLRAVYGNIDDDKARMEFPLHNRFLCEGVDVWITHIGGYPGKYNQAIRTEIHRNSQSFLFAGIHTYSRCNLIRV